MNELDLDSFEISIESDIKAIKPKAKRKGYARELVEKLHSTIEQALSEGCSYEQIAEVLKLRKIKISATTLKRYHKANSKNEKNSIQQPKGSTSSQPSKKDSTRMPKSSQKPEPVRVSTQNDRTSVPDLLSGSALTDEDYADDFNDY